MLRTIAGFANNNGGYLLFGVHPATNAVEGMKSDHFAKTDPAKINRALSTAFDPVPIISKSIISLDEKIIGVIHVSKHEYPPVIALKNIDDTVREGSIYYRYVAETLPIKPGELRQIIAMRERRAIAEFADRMGRVAEGRDATLNLATGEVTGSTGGFLIDKELLPKIQFIREGDFSQKRGAPALKLIGEVEPVDIKEKENARIIRDAVTPDAIIRNFLLEQPVVDPMQYILAHAHCQRRWLPVWYYVVNTEIDPDEIADQLRKITPTNPVNRDITVRRLLKKENAYRAAAGKSRRLCDSLMKGETPEIDNISNCIPFANAITGLKDLPPNGALLRSLLLKCLDMTSAKTPAMSVIYRAACRLDELLHIKN
ncbi:hypothetical protein mvi_49160 [Methylobacterium indicum]|uniref:Schlafen AlbA-2 domain-containing protein n=2 Tax=Methylobacterium indicum TaxID=1775910 RepID=A0A8H8WXK2_9HYPH|nr:hypothetical protein mvi_49160 [Methylobacterium indicum]